MIIYKQASSYSFDNYLLFNITLYIALYYK